MADQVEIQIPKSVIPEETGFTATAYFRDRATGTASTPTTVHYRIDDLNTNTVLKEWTSVTAAANVSIAIDFSLNAIQQDSKLRERKQIIVQADRGLSTQATGVASWEVHNLTGIKISD